MTGKITAGLARDGTAPPTPTTKTREEKLEERRKSLIRRKLEHELISRLDKRGVDIRRQDCWFLMDSQWIQRWMLYTQPGLAADEAKQEGDEKVDDNEGEGGDELEEELTPSPGPVSSARLIEPGLAPTSAPVVLRNLQPVVDYRGVPSFVYFTFVELHGKDSSPELARYHVDIYKPQLPIERVIPIRYRAQTTSRILVDEIRPNWITWERHYSDDENDIDDNGRSPICCCGLTREHLETLIYWAVMCCTRASRKSSGRKNISYRKYKPLKYQDGDSKHGLPAEEIQLTARARQRADSAATEEMSNDDHSVEEWGRDYHRPLFQLPGW